MAEQLCVDTWSFIVVVGGLLIVASLLSALFRLEDWHHRRQLRRREVEEGMRSEEQIGVRIERPEAQLADDVQTLEDEVTALEAEVSALQSERDEAHDQASDQRAAVEALEGQHAGARRPRVERDANNNTGRWMMPTGYTADVQDGKVTDFRTFARRCARAMGALIGLRDEPMDAPIPGEFAPSSYNEQGLAKAKTRLAELDAMTPGEAVAACEQANKEATQQERESQERTAITRSRYEWMLEKARAWAPPTASHEGLKTFMVEQLEESIKFDCFELDPSEAQEPGEWYATQQKNVMRDIGRHAEGDAEEKQRTASRNRWLRALRESLEGE